MFPIMLENQKAAAIAIMDGIIKSLAAGGTWTTLSLQDLIAVYCVKERHSVEVLHLAIKEIVAAAPDRVVLIPSAELFASNTLSATFPGARAHELGSYYRDRFNRLISHLRLHNSIARMDYGQFA